MAGTHPQNGSDFVAVCAVRVQAAAFSALLVLPKNRTAWDGKFVGISGAFSGGLVVLVNGFVSMEWVYCR